MDKMRMETLDLTAQNIDKIAALFPNCITETKGADGKLKRAVNFDLLRQMLSGDLVEGDEAYEFTWVGKKAAIVEANKPIRKTLRPCPAESVNWDSTENLYIEGDNLDVLKLLQESYLGKVKMIYIDPPYNTGNDFIYRDDFAQSAEDYAEQAGVYDEETGDRLFKNTDSNGRFHSDWCSMIYSRLMVARALLSEDGFIAISIGEEEVDNLRKICDEVFGEANFRNILEVRRYDKNLNLQFADNGLSTMNVGLEYILIYSKNRSSKMVAVYKESTDERASSGYWKGFWNNADRPTMRYDVLGVTPIDGQWKWQKSVADEAVQNYIEYERLYSSQMTIEEYWKMTGKCKRFIRRNPKGTGKNLGVEHWVAPADGILRNSNWSDMLVSKPAGLGIPFDSPKNPDVIKELVKLFDVEEGDLVLDFFSGSASTACAVLQLAVEDQTRRRFIMIQLQEVCDEKTEAYKAGYQNICEIGKERIRRAAKKIAGEHPDATFDGGFRVFKLADSNMKDVYYAPAEMDQNLLTMLESNIKEDRTDLDLLFGCLLEWGLPLSLGHITEEIDGCKVHTYGLDKEEMETYQNNSALLTHNSELLIACFDENIPDSVIKAIAKRKPLRAVFRDSSFSGSPQKINVGEIFKLLAPDTRVKVI